MHAGRDGSEQEDDMDDGQDSELNSSFAFDNGSTPGDVVRFFFAESLPVF